MSTVFEASYDELKRLEDENEQLRAELKEALDANGWLANTVAAEALRLRAALANISYHYANQDMGHQAFRVYAKRTADTVLEGNGVNNEQLAPTGERK